MRRLSEQESEGRALATPPLPPPHVTTTKSRRLGLRSVRRAAAARVGKSCALERVDSHVHARGLFCLHEHVWALRQRMDLQAFSLSFSIGPSFSPSATSIASHTPTRFSHPTHSERERVASTTRRDQSLNDGDCSP